MIWPGSDDTPPLTPDVEEAATWAREELSKPEYRHNKSILGTIIDSIIDMLSNISVRPFSPGAPIMAILVSLILIGLIILLTIFISGWLNPHSQIASEASADGEIFEDSRTRIQYLQTSSDAAHREDWYTACVEMFRAVVKQLNSRGVVTIIPGLTATEAMTQASLKFPQIAPDLQWAAASFNRIRFGKWDADEETYRRLLALDEQLSLPIGPQMKVGLDG